MTVTEPATSPEVDDPDVVPSRSLALGYEFVCVLRQGRVLCAGHAPGLTSIGRLTPIEGLSDVVEIDGVDRTLCARRANGTVWCRMDDEPAFELPRVNDAVRVRVDLNVTVLRADGTLEEVSLRGAHEALPIPRFDASADLVAHLGYACGLGSEGRVACGETRATEARVFYERGARGIALDNGTLEIVTETGEVLADHLPMNERIELTPRAAMSGLLALRGRCGLRHGVAVCPEDDDEFRHESGLPEGRVEGHPFVEVARGFTLGCALDREANLYCWGGDVGGILGTPGHETWGPTEVQGLTDATLVTLGDDHACALRATGAVVCWGEGLGATPQPVSLEAIGGAARALASNSLATCALGADGEVVCWGRRREDSMFETTVLPLPATLVEGITDAVEIVGTGGHVCARIGEPTTEVRCWTPGQPSFVVADLAASSILGGGLGFVCGLVAGTLRCHAFGDPLEPPRSPPFDHLELGAIERLAIGGESACWWTRNHWMCSGHNGTGQLGARPSPPLTTPVRFPGAMTSLTLAAHRSCGVDAAGRVQCAGVLLSGAARDPEVDRGRGGLTRIGDITDARSVALGTDLGCAVLASGGVRCWGDGYQGGLGDGTSSIVTTPTLVQ